MNADSVSVLQGEALEFFGDIIEEAREHARLMGATQAEPSHLLYAIVGRPHGLVLLANSGSEPTAIQASLRSGHDATRQKPLKVKPPFDDALDAALFSGQVRLQTAGMEFYKEGIGRPVIRLMLSIIDRHAERDPVCNAALACITLDDIDVERFRREEAEIDALLDEIDTSSREAAASASQSIPDSLNPELLADQPMKPVSRKSLRGPLSSEVPKTFTRAEPAAPPSDEGSRPAPRAQQSGSSHLARDAAEVEAAVARAFRSLSEEAAEGKIDPVIGRESEIDRIIRALMRRRKRSVILYGPAGVGKTAIAEGIALALRAQGVPRDLSERTLYELSLPALVAGARYRGDFEERITKAVDRIRKEGAITFIDEIHTVMGLGATQTKGMDAPNILKPALARGDIMVIGATTTEELALIRQDRAIMRRFEFIEVREPDLDGMHQILDRSAWAYLDHHNLRSGSDLFEAVLDISTRLMPDQRFPDKAFDLLDRSCVEALRVNSKEVDAGHVRAAAERAGLLFAARPSKTALRRLDAACARLADAGLGREVIASIEPGLALSLLAPAAIRGAQGWMLVGSETACNTTIDALADTFNASVTRFSRNRICEPGAMEWLIGSSYMQAAGQHGALVEALENGPGDLFVLEGVDQAPPGVIDLIEQMVRRGEFRSGSGRIIRVRNLRLALTAAPARSTPIGFGAGAGVELPPTLARLDGLSGMQFVALEGSAQEDDAVATLLGGLTGYLEDAGLEILIEPDLEAALHRTLPQWEAQAGQIRDLTLGHMVLVAARSPEVMTWRLSLMDGSDQGPGARPQLTLIPATP